MRDITCTLLRSELGALAQDVCRVAQIVSLAGKPTHCSPHTALKAAAWHAREAEQHAASINRECEQHVSAHDWEWARPLVTIWVAS